MVDGGCVCGIKAAAAESMAAKVVHWVGAGLCSLLRLQLCGVGERGRIGDCSSRVGAGGVEGGCKSSGIAVSARCTALAGAKVRVSVIVVVVAVGLLVLTNRLRQLQDCGIRLVLVSAVCCGCVVAVMEDRQLQQQSWRRR